MREPEQDLGGGIVEDVWIRWKEKVIAVVEKGTGRKKVTERSEGWRSEDVRDMVVGGCGERGQRDGGRRMWRG